MNMSEKKTYNVSIPTTGIAYFTVEAESEEEAIEAALSGDYEHHDHEWEYREHMNSGWVSHLMLNDAEAEEIRDY